MAETNQTARLASSSSLLHPRSTVCVGHVSFHSKIGGLNVEIVSWIFLNTKQQKISVISSFIQMHRPVYRARLRSVADALFKFKSSDNGRRHVKEKLESCRPVTTISGPSYSGYGQESTAKSLQAQIVKALHQGQRREASNLLLAFGNGSQSLRVEDFVYILKYCANKPDPLFVMETWRLMEEKDIGLNDMCCLLLMHALCRAGYLEEAYDFIKFLGENHGLSHALRIYNCFLAACVKMQSISHAARCLDLMDQQMVGKNEITYIVLLKLAVWQQNLSAVREIWQDYIKHYNANIFSLRKFICSFLRLKDLESAYETLQHMVTLALSGKFFFNKTAKGSLYSKGLDIPIPSEVELQSQKVNFEETEHSLSRKLDTDACITEQGTVSDVVSRDASNATGILSLLNNYESMPVKLLRWSFGDVIHACANAKKCGLAEQLLLQMQSLGLQPTQYAYNGFVRAVTTARGFNAGMEMLEEMQERKMKPHNSTLAALSVQCSKALELDLAEALLDQISKCPYAYPYNAFLEACDTLDQPERAVRTFAKMQELKVKPDTRTYALLFSLFGSVNAPYEKGNMLSQVDSAKRIKAIEMDMAKNGVQHSPLSMKNLLKALGAEGMIRELLQYLHLAEDLFYHTDTNFGIPAYNTVLQSLVEAGENHMAIKIFKSMKSCGVQPDASTYNIMIDCCSYINCFKSACALVSMMVRDGFYPQTTTYTALMKVLLDFENFDEALHLLDQAILEGNQLDVLLFNTFLKKACDKGRIDIIELIIELMHQEKVQPDPSTCCYVFSAYVDREFHSTAVEALQVLSMRMISEEDSTRQEIKMLFEDDFILSEDSEAELLILQFFKDSEENLAAALLNLRWCAMLGFPISWSPNESPWARRLTNNHEARSKSCRVSKHDTFFGQR
ncbi:hypothetical protein SLEP1_g11162 [Rubroshorea leprosula]|uniref:Pentatricopeptide repeat-containing protein n=2 Tax=Rubroshorea leprosula TaxID=152421 RepID=A0AAV5IG74_9ROSI|nr:hypothetical protein SLEP1_g11162 [Rubroshorea leprosula]